MLDDQSRAAGHHVERRSQLVRTRTRAKNEVQSALIRRLVGRPPVSDLFGVKGRSWLAALELPVEERETVDACMRQVEFLDSEIAAVERVIAEDALTSPDLAEALHVLHTNYLSSVPDPD